jgi:hypothetical protein
MAHLDGRSLDLGSDEALEPIDLALRDLLRRSPWPHHYDLIGGLVGLAVYALERLPNPVARECLESVVARLEETAQERPEGLAWWSKPIGVLGRIAAAGVARERVGPLLEGAVSWTLAQSLPAGGTSRFPSYFAEEHPRRPVRSAWCYGDPGVSAALLLAARCAGRKDWEREALATARLAARRPDEEAAVQDAGVCHGAAGLGHVYSRLYHASGEEELRTAARRWFRRALDLRDPAAGPTGYRFLVSEPGRMDLVWKEDPSLLVGACGVALALLGASTEVAPDWDDLLLVSIPPRE